MFIKRLLLVLAAAAVLCSPAYAAKPSNVECIAPADPGGGWDFTCRSVGRLLTKENLVNGNVKVTNMPGGVGAVAYANVISSRDDDPNLLVATSTVGVTQIAQGKYPAGMDKVRWLAMMGTDVGTVLVNPNSKYNSLKALMKALKNHTKKIVAGGSSGFGGWDHLRFLEVAQKAGVPNSELKDIRWVQFDSGSKAVTQLLGGKLDVVVTDVGEISGFIKSGKVDALAILGDHRLKDFPKLKTAKEQGVDVTGYNWRGFYVGGNVSDKAYNNWVKTLKKLYNTKAWHQTAIKAGLSPQFRGGKKFQAFVKKTKKRMAKISKAIGVIK